MTGAHDAAETDRRLLQGRNAAVPL